MIDPQTPKKKIRIIRLPLDPTGRFAEFTHITDTQIGADEFDEKEFYATLNMILALKHMRWTDGGDNDDNAEFRGYLGNTMIPRQQWQYALQAYKPIADKLMVAVEGNHEYDRVTTAIKNVVPWYRWSWQAIGAENAIVAEPNGEVTFVARVGKIDYFICVQHSGTAAKDKFKAAKDSESVRLVDVYAYGHNHQKGRRPKRLFKAVKKRGRWYKQEFELTEVAGGSYLREPHYIRPQNKPLPGLGSLIIRLHADTHHVEVLEPRQEYPQHMVAGRYKPDVSFTLDNAHVNPRRSRK